MPWLPTSSTGRASPSDRELRLCGDVSDGCASRRTRRVAVAQRHRPSPPTGPRRSPSIPTRERLADVRRRRGSRPRSPCSASQTDLADLGDITSGTCDVVRRRADPARRRRPEPAAPAGPPHPQAEHAVRDLDAAPVRQRVDRRAVRRRPANGRRVVHHARPVELPRRPSRRTRREQLVSPSPTTLILRARKEGS